MTEKTSALSIRRATEADMDALYEICLKTADSGKDASALYSNPKLPGYIWAAPYGKFEPDFTFLLDDGEKAIGYVIGTPDTAAFGARLAAEWWPDIRKIVAGMQPSAPLDAGALERIANPDRPLADLHADYPAHLHINILPDAQSSGWGRRLIETQLEALKAHGAAGIHLGVSPTNEKAKGFYRHLGFEDISRDGHVIFGMKFRA